jgi:hypothetical protein
MRICLARRPDFVDAAPPIPARAGWGRAWLGGSGCREKGAILGLDAGLSTLEIEVGENVGEDWEEVLDQRQRKLSPA